MPQLVIIYVTGKAIDVRLIRRGGWLDDGGDVHRDDGIWLFD